MVRLNSVKNFANIKKVANFAAVFHGIRFKVRRLFVVTTSNFLIFVVLTKTKWDRCLEMSKGSTFLVSN